MNEDKWKRWEIGGASNKNILRIGVVFLAIVSFFTTANGMKQYIFTGNSVIAYSASAAIQGILLALSMNLPGYLRGICQKQGNKAEEYSKWWQWFFSKIGRFFVKFSLCACVILLTIITIFCSSWFSYIFIADTIHQNSWGTDSQLLVQQTYRTELYNARDYAHTYRVYLEEKLGENILLLEEQAQQLNDTETDSEINWEEERTNYVSDTTTMAGSYMSVVISAMEKALGEENSPANRNLAVTTLADAKENIANRMDSIQQNVSILNENIDSYNNQIASLSNRIYRATEGTDTTALTNAVNNFTWLITEATERQAALQLEYMQLDSALQRLPYYESLLGLSSSTSSTSVRNKLMALQSEIFQQNPDEAKILEIATDIFEDLRNAASTISDDKTLGQSFSYTNMLIQMNRLIQNLRDYSEVKDIEANLEEFIDNLRSVEKASTEPKESSDSNPETELGKSGESDEAEAPGELGKSDETEESEENGGEEQGEVSESGEPDRADNLEESGEQGSSAEMRENNMEPGAGEPDTQDSESEKSEQWKQVWNSRLADLKAQISAMPIYSVSEEVGFGTESTLSEVQADILYNYDRDKSGRELDDMVRRYISNHNAIYQGIIYLQSPYRSLALFALVLALSFDLSGFIFGFVMQGDNQNSINPDSEISGVNSEMSIIRSDISNLDTELQTGWDIIKTLKPYFVLTGDYESIDGSYYYKAFRDGVPYRWAVKDTTPYEQGIYIQQEIDNNWSKGQLLNSEGDQNILFAYQKNNPQDGVYKNCLLIFDEGSLVLARDNHRNFIAGIEEYVPVHCYSPSQGQNQTFPAKQLAEKKCKAKIAVVALNARGTRIAAVYVIENEVGG